MNNPLISIITVVYNGVATLEQTILSVINQTYKNIEYIIIDGGSTDGTIEIIKKYEKHLAYWISEPDKGIYDAMNKGIAKATGKLIGLINSDDWYELNAVEHVVNEFLIANITNVIIHANIYKVRNDSKTIFRPKKHYRLMYGMCIGHPSCFITKHVYDSIGLYDSHYKIAADFDLLLRAYLKKIKYIHIDNSLVNMRIGGASDIDYILGLKEQRSILMKNGFSYFHANFIYFIYYLFVKQY
jgi:glycosyltransferase involved in cell wall biosynthesis